MDILTPHTRGLIVRALEQKGEWKGTRGPLRLVFRLSAQPTLDNSRVEWRARIGGRWHSGIAPTVTDAEQEIDRRRRGELRHVAELIEKDGRICAAMKGKP